MADSSQSPAHTALNSRAPSLGEKEKQEGLETRTLTAVNSRQTSDTVPKEGESAAAPPAPVHGGPIVDESKLLTGRKLFLVFVGFLLSVLLIALDQTIVATALPQIASDFEALDQLTWIVSAYFLTQAGLMLTYGQFLTVARVKWLYLVAIFIFELGSLICGVAPNIEVLIFGRAIQGVGASGIFISVLTVIAQITKLESRPALFGSFGGVFALASVVGPLLGGVFTDEVTWRWCFYINLPLGAVSILAVVIWLPAYDPPENPAHVGMTTVQKWLSLDWLGSFLSLGMITPLLLALQWGGQTRPWNDRAVIACLVVFAVMLFIFIGWEYYMGSRAMMPLKMWKRRTQVGAAGATFFLMLMFITATYYLPFFYQAKGRTATQSGLDIIPFMLSAVVGTAGAGAVINFTGRYLPWLITGPGIAAIGAGLLYTIDYYTPNPNLIGYQILFGFGAGIAFQNGIVAIQAEYADEPDLVPQATSLVTFLQLVGGVVGIAIAGTVFGNRLTTNLNSLPPNTLTPAEFAQVKLSVHAIFQLSDAVRQQVVDAYINAVDYTFLVDIPAGGLALMFACLVRNWNLKERGGGVGGGMA